MPGRIQIRQLSSESEWIRIRNTARKPHYDDVKNQNLEWKTAANFIYKVVNYSTVF